MKRILSVLIFLSTCPSVFASVYDVTIYGAVADDGVSDTSAIQSALNAAASAGGGTVYVPAGTYHVENLLVGDFITIEGDGQGASVLESPETLSGNINRILSNAGGAALDNSCIIVRDLGFRGWTDEYTSSPDGKGRQGINFWRTSDVLIERCRFENLDFGVINQQDSHRVNIVACTAVNMSVYGFYLQKRSVDGVDYSCSHFRYTGCRVENCQGAFRAWDSDHITYVGCIAVNATSRSAQSDSSRRWHHTGTLLRGGQSSGMTTAASGVDGGQAHGGTTNGPTHKPFDLQFTGCVAAGFEENGFELHGATDYSLSGCISYSNDCAGLLSDSIDYPGTGEIPQRFSVKGGVFKENGEHGFLLNGVHSGVISDALILNNSRSAGGTYDGVRIGDGTYLATSVYSHHITVENCLISDDQAANTQNYAVSSVQNSDYVKVLLSDVSGNVETNTPISLAGANNLTGLNVQ